MRLIDADRLFDNLERGVRNTSNEVFREIMNTPTVKAIPIEWIKKWLNETEDDMIVCFDIRDMLANWEKENE